eukprot:3917379-Pyramimonas_sp.AAC.2
MAYSRPTLKRNKDVGRCFMLLGLPSHSTEAEVRRAYRTLVRKEHPDKGGSDAKFQEIQTAYDTLTLKVGRSAPCAYRIMYSVSHHSVMLNLKSKRSLSVCAVQR